MSAQFPPHGEGGGRCARNLPVNTPHECIRGQEADGAGQQAVHAAGQQAVAEEQQAGDEALDFKLGEVVPGAVEEDPQRTAAANEEGLPPPVVVLRGEIVISSRFLGRENAKGKNTEGYGWRSR